MQKYTPLSQRPHHEILAQAEHYLEMAATARTPQAKRGLEALAVRLVALADRRADAESRSLRPAQVMEAAGATP
jgi:hypothetical protein